jgi:hypothetical protein
MYAMKEMDMLSAKIDLLIKRLDERVQDKEAMMGTIYGGIDPYTLMAANRPSRRRWPNSPELAAWITQLIGIPRGIYKD